MNVCWYRTNFEVHIFAKTNIWMRALQAYPQNMKNGADMQVKARIPESVFRKRLLTQKRNLAAKLIVNHLIKMVHDSGDPKETQNPAIIYLFKVNNRNTWRHWRRSGLIITSNILLLTLYIIVNMFTPFFSVSIAACEQVHVSWKGSKSWNSLSRLCTSFFPPTPLFFPHCLEA